MSGIKLKDIDVCGQTVDIINEQLQPSQDEGVYKGLKHLKCCKKRVTGDIDDPTLLNTRELLLCKIVCVGRSIVRRFNFDYLKYICNKSTRCLGRLKNIITTHSPWFYTENVNDRIKLISGLDRNHVEYPLRLIEYFNDLVRSWEDGEECSLDVLLNQIFPNINLIGEWYSMLLRFRSGGLTLRGISEGLTRVMYRIVEDEARRKSIRTSGGGEKNLQLALEDLEHGFNLFTIDYPERSIETQRTWEERQRQISPNIKTIIEEEEEGKSTERTSPPGVTSPIKKPPRGKGRRRAARKKSPTSRTLFDFGFGKMK